MQITPFAVKDLKPTHWQAWEDIRHANPELASPHFSSRFIQCLADVRPSVEVAVLEQHGQLLGFLPYHRRREVGEPVAGSFSELQGLVAPADLQFDPRELLRACGLSRLAFTDALACQSSLKPLHAVQHECPYLDLSQGFEAYLANRRAAGTDELKQTMRKMRKIERDVAPLRFEPYSRDPAILETLLEWKQRQLKERKLCDPLRASWPKQLMRQLLNIQSDEFGGMLSVLYVGGTPSAATMSIRSRHVVNCWVTSFEPTYHRFSPGLILLSELARSAQQLGIRRIDLGRGSESYKKSFCDGFIPVAEGGVDRNRFAHALRHATFQAREWVRTTALGKPARQVIERCRYAFSQWKT